MILVLLCLILTNANPSMKRVFSHTFNSKVEGDEFVAMMVKAKGNLEKAIKIFPVMMSNPMLMRELIQDIQTIGPHNIKRLMKKHYYVFED